ncbi:unnamed protein product [Vicia faba]|uniref:Essential protein Yae1 N-terminal domain-containing protein n=1 Tax=Vicia faba TaxID=3906 RepID=A0AAV0ZPR7_VICFA|nr:unnamed protein product [Vicia faba]
MMTYDPFDSSVNLEETHLKEGYKDGLVTGKDEGKKVGLKVGFEIGEELSFYSGWPKLLFLRCKDLIQKYPLMDPEGLQVQEIMDSIRLKFKMICSSLRVKLHYKIA